MLHQNDNSKVSKYFQAVSEGLHSNYKNEDRQGFVTIGSRNHLVRVISTYVGNTKKSGVSSNMGCKGLDHISGGGGLAANNKTIHSPTSRHCYFYSLKSLRISIIIGFC